MKKILIVDDELNHRLMMRLHLEDNGFECFEAENGVDAYNALKKINPDLMLLDITMDVMDGLTLLNKIRLEGFNLPTLMITANTDIKTAVTAMKIGATDFVTKPVEISELLKSINLFLNEQPQNQPNEPKNKLNYKFCGVYSAEPMQKIIEMLAMVSHTDATVLILGESGTGKELIAKSIHENSARDGKPFIAVNCAALNDNLIESELFGHVKGAFTGAVADRKGRFEQAAGGTIFLDELGEIPLSTQTKLLRVLQEKVYEPVGSNKPLKTDARIIAATNKDLKQMSSEGTFRQDLYFRLSVFPVTIPPLRQRREDIRPLVKYFINKYAIRFGKNINSATEKYLKKLENYSFPGNIRELENIVERSLILCREDKLKEDTLPDLDTKNFDTGSVKLNLKDNEKQAIIDTLEKCGNNRTKAAKVLGISRRALYYKMEEFGIEK